MSVFDKVSTIKSKVCSDPVGLIQAMLKDLPNEGTGIEYDEWLNLVSLLKYEIDDEDVAFELFDEFSQRSDDYDADFTHKKFYESQMEGTGQISIGTLVFMVKRDVHGHTPANYDKYYNSEHVSALKVMKAKIKKSLNKLPDHILPDPIEQIKMPEVRVDPTLALVNLLREDVDYCTAEHWAQPRNVRPYDGDKLEQYITCNPVKDGMTRAQASILHYDYAIVEFDTISLDEQWSVLAAIDLPYEALIFTGNKSIHAWVRIDAPDLETYKQRTRLINKMFEDFGYSKKNNNQLDTAVLYDCASWVRTPSASRVSLKDTDKHTTGVEQKVLWTEKCAGWDDWYENTYPSYVVASSLEEVPEVVEPEEFVPPEKEHNFQRKLQRVKALLKGEDYKGELREALQDAPDRIDLLDEAMNAFFQGILSLSNRKFILTASDLYHINAEIVEEIECHLLPNLWKACLVAEQYETIRRKELREKLEEQVEDIVGQITEYVDVALVESINNALYMALQDDKADKYEELVSSIKTVFEALNYRTAILQDKECHKYFGKAGKLLASEFSSKGDTDQGTLYSFRRELSAFCKHDSSFDKITTILYPSFISHYLAFVKKDVKGLYNVVALDNDSVGKLLVAPHFINKFREVEFLSDVPIFKESDTSLISGYDEEKKVLVTGSSEGYELLPIEEAREVLLELFEDFKFMSPSDLSRAVACLIIPAMCHADLLRGDSRPLVYIDADGHGAGKGTMAYFLTLPYVDQPEFVTQDDSTVGSIDEKIGCAIQTGGNHIIVDNLKPTKGMSEFSSSFIESMMTTDSIRFRAAKESACTLSLKYAILYLTTNGMPLSKDLADRSLYISIRKQDTGYNYRSYPEGFRAYVISQRPRIMSAIYSVMKEYVDRDKPMKQPKERHRFLSTIPIMNYIVTEILGLAELTEGVDVRNNQKSDRAVDLARTCCFILSSAGLLGQPLSNLDIFEALAEADREDILGLDYNLQLYSDDNCEVICKDAKRAIGMKLSKAFSRPSLLGKAGAKKEMTECQVEEFKIQRVYSDRQPKYIFTKAS